MVGLAREHCAVKGNGALQFAVVVIEHAEIVVGLDQLGVDRDGLFILRNRFGAPVEGAQAPAQHDAGLGRGRPNLHRLGVERRRRRDGAQAALAVARQHGEFVVVGMERQRRLERRGRTRKIAAHKAPGRQQLQGVEMIGHGCQHGPTQALGLIELAGLLVLHGLGKLFCICVRHGRPKYVVRRVSRAVR